MSSNPFMQNSDTSNSSYNDDYKEKPRLIKIFIIVFCVFLGIFILGLLIYVTIPKNIDKNTQSATAAAKKLDPNAQARSVKIADGFAVAIVSDPTSDSQLKSGNSTFFKVNQDGSMIQLVSGSYFSPIDLLSIGIPLATQAKLQGFSLDKIQQTLASMCSYDGGTMPGYSGFNASFNPDGWQIDSTTLSDLEQVLTTTLVAKNSSVNTNQQIICVSAIRDNSNLGVNTQTGISTFILQIQFITKDGTFTTHAFNFVISPGNNRSYTLDGQKIQ